MKEGGCQHVDCPRCGMGFCWDCAGGGNPYGRAVELAHSGAVYHQNSCRQFRMCCAAMCLALPGVHACATGLHRRVADCPACAALDEPDRACTRVAAEGPRAHFRVCYGVEQRVLYYDSGVIAALHAELARPPLDGAIPSAAAMADVANRELTKLWSGRDPWDRAWSAPQPSLRQRFEAARQVAVVVECTEVSAGEVLHTIRIETTGAELQNVPERELSHLDATWPDCRCPQCKACQDDDVAGR